MFASLQMAAEALISRLASDANGQYVGAVTGDALERELVEGNDHASKFTAEAARKFSTEWAVVKQQASTSTGFSATLFQYKGKDDPDRGLTTWQYVMSFRSTKFIDDAVRDNLETNTQEVREFGWAFGQIFDMEKFRSGLDEDARSKGATATG